MRTRSDGEEAARTAMCGSAGSARGALSMHRHTKAKAMLNSPREGKDGYRHSSSPFRRPASVTALGRQKNTPPLPAACCVKRICKPNFVSACAAKIIHLPLALPRWSSNLPGDWLRERAVPSSPYLVLLRRGFAMPYLLAQDAVRSYRTVSPLPPRRVSPPRSAVCFLLHFPSRRRAWPLASLLPVGVRTFLHPEGRRSSDLLHTPTVTEAAQKNSSGSEEESFLTQGGTSNAEELRFRRDE